MLELKNLLLLAPLAGFTDKPFREVVKKFGVDITVSEMISSHALVYQNAKTLKMLEKSPIESPYSVQISGSDEGIISKAVKILNDCDFVDIIDFNCGCPAPKVAHHGNGSGLLRDLPKLVRLVNLIRSKSNKKYTSLKLRLGYDQNIKEEIASALNDCEIDYCVVHGRTKKDGYKADKIDYSAIAYIKQNTKIPIIANGEIKSAKEAIEVLDITGANGVMIGRAALKSPWIFFEIKELLSGNSFEEKKFLELKKQVVLQHFENMIEFYGQRGVILFRKNLHLYAKSMSNCSEFKTAINTIKEIEKMREVINNFF